jgi:hypothetical protein
MTTKIRFNHEFLQQFCKENGIELTKDYSLEKVNRDTIIEAKCLTEGCQDICSKKYIQFIKTGSYCKMHTKENRKEKVKQTCIEKYGTENPFQSKELKEKIKLTNLKKLGVEYPTQSKKVMEKAKQTCLEKYGVENPNQNKEIREEDIHQI